jgi:outer membrane lipoprotein-sorting protein
MNRALTTFRKLAGVTALAAMAVTAAAPVTVQQATAQSGGVTLEQAVAALRDISTLRADFTQTDRNDQRVDGALTLKRPGRIRFQYEKSVNMLIVGDGKSLTLIDYDVRQVQRWPIKNSPLGALLDPKRDLALYGSLKPTRSPDIASVEVRDSKHPEYGIITLVFVRDPSAPGGLELVSWVALDSQNKRTTIRLSNHRYGVPVSDSAFRWKDPRPRVRR